jgi:hypothetical protein
MLLSKISSRGSGVKSTTMADQNLRARKFEHIRGKTLTEIHVQGEARWKPS